MKKKKILIFNILVTFTLFILPSITVNALEINNDYITKNQGTLADVELNKQNLIKRNLETQNYFENSNKFLNNVQSEVSPLYSVPITDAITGYLDAYKSREQEKWYYCGPATVQSIVANMKGQDEESQDTYASNMGTNSSEGTYVYKMTNELNRAQDKFTYAHQYVSNGNSDLVWSAVVSDIPQGKAVVLHAMTKSLYLYNGNNIHHYLTAIGYFGTGLDSSEQLIQYSDTWTNNYGRGVVYGNHWEERSNVAASVYGRYIIY